ncbi:MAG: hypothetical protein HC875_35940 [Anaerolineales bacterium]|nr:hypothetical protein [Anaerolineales bacterium]
MMPPSTNLSFSYNRVATALQQAGFTLEATLRRAPYPEVEHPSERAYLLARKPSTASL